MPIALLIYDLSSEQEEYEEALIRGPRYRMAWADVYNKLRSKLKYEEISEAEADVYEKVRDWIAEACNEHEIDIP